MVREVSQGTRIKSQPIPIMLFKHPRVLCHVKTENQPIYNCSVSTNSGRYIFKFNCIAWDNGRLSYAWPERKTKIKILTPIKFTLSCPLFTHSSCGPKSERQKSSASFMKTFQMKNVLEVSLEFHANFNWNDDYKSNVVNYSCI